MATREHLSVKVDYLSIVFDSVRADEVIFMLNMPKCLFREQKASVKHKDYQKLYRCGQIKLFGDSPCTIKNPLGLGAYLVLGGKGCDELSTFTGKHFGLFFERLRRAFGSGSFHITRLDLAIDDKNEHPFFTIEQIRKKCRKKEFLSRCDTLTFYESGNGEDMANTVYIGAKKSQISFRFYDKDKQISKNWDKPLEEIGSWKRTEIQLRDEMAHTFGTSIKVQDMSQMTFGLLKDSLRFVIPDPKQKNKSRWKTCQFWERFIGNAEPIKLKTEKQPSSLEDNQTWLRSGGALSSIQAFLFLEGNQALGTLKCIDDLMIGLTYSSELAHKIISHLTEIKRDDLIPKVYECTKKEP